MKTNPIAGTKNTQFEFKLLSNGNLAFIRYYIGERENALTHYIHCGLYSDDEGKQKCVSDTLRAYQGSNKRVIAFAQALSVVPFDQTIRNTVWAPNK